MENIFVKDYSTTKKWSKQKKKKPSRG